MSRPRSKVLADAFADLGELLARSQSTAAALDYGRYRDDPCGFISDVLGGTLWAKQREIAEAVRDNAQVTVRSCHAAGKDWLAARLALWWVYSRRGLVILTAPSAQQCEEILMRREVFAAFRAGSLPGELHVRALRPGGTGEAGIIAKTGTGVHGLTGLHASDVLYIVSEAQAPEIEHAIDAGFACTTGARDRLLLLGNPTEPTGRFYRSHQPDSGWVPIRIAASDIPNVAQDDVVVPGLLTRQAVDRFVREYGADSAYVISRVHAEFPTESTDELLSVAWLERAIDFHRRDVFRDDVREADYVLGIDPARMGPDRSVCCIRRGPHVCEFIEWRRADTMASAERVVAIAQRLLMDFRPNEGSGGAVDAVIVDSIGIGAGVLDRLGELLPTQCQFTRFDRSTAFGRIRHQYPSPTEFVSSQSAHLPERYSNLRAQGFWHLRKLLEEGRIALPDNAELRKELLAIRVKFDAAGKVVLEAKDQIKARLGHSPDYADALVISLAPLLDRGRTQKRRAFVFGYAS